MTKDILKHKGFSFVGCFLLECQEKSIPTSLKSLVSMIINGRTSHPLIGLAGKKRMAVGFPSGLHSQKCLDHAENLSSALIKLSLEDANVQRRACPALISANANAANDSFVMYITTVSSHLCPETQANEIQCSL